jgi:hypothetical protein
MNRAGCLSSGGIPVFPFPRTRLKLQYSLDVAGHAFLYLELHRGNHEMPLDH